MSIYNVKTKYVQGPTATILVVLLFCPPLLSYLEAFVSIITSQIILYVLVFVMMFYYIIRRSYRFTTLDHFWLLVYIYLIFLFFRLFSDYLSTGQGNFLYKTPATVLFFFLFPIFFPALFFSRVRFRIDTVLISWVLVGILTICLTVSLISIMSGNVAMTIDGRFDSGFGVFSIEYGHFGTSLVLICLSLIKHYSCRLKTLIFFTPIIAIGVVSIALSGSRGPFMALMICLCTWFINTHKLRTSVLTIIIIIIASALLKDLLYALNDMLENNGITSFNRILDSVFAEDGIEKHTSGRDKLYEIGLARFLDSPFFGCSLFIPGKIYVHNIVIEQFMALGIVGGTLFLTFNIIAFIRTFKIFRKDREYTPICLLFIQYFVFGCLSCTIISLPIYWLMLFLISNHWNTDIKNKLECLNVSSCAF